LHKQGAEAKTCVVVSYWIGHSLKSLLSLLAQMMRVDAGTNFDLIIVCNGGDRQPLVLPSKFDRLRPRIFNRENQGYNIGAWEYGWRISEGYRYYLFLQEECFLKAKGWVSEFEYRMSVDRGVGLLGEAIMWDRMSWQYIREATDRDLGLDWFAGEPVHPLDAYQAFLNLRGIPLGEVGSHLQSLVLFTSGQVLSEINGFPTGISYREAVACEIGISRLVEAKGYRISKIKDHPYALIGHRQWTKAYTLGMNVRQLLIKGLRQLGVRRNRSLRSVHD
jgi:hypothetical protein